jgi:elongation factor Ts
MAEISAAMVRDLRERTDAPMMECKKALTEANGDVVKAEEILRIKLGNKASKAASRVAAEGIVGVYLAQDGKSGAMVEVNCETDFVAKNDDFVQFARNLAKLVGEKKPRDVTELSALQLDSAVVEEVRKSLVGKIGENLAIRRLARIEGKGTVAQYVHGGAKIGVLVDVVGGDTQLAKDLAMHIAATKPVALSKNQVPAEVLKKERDIAVSKAAESGKPPNIVEKMVEGSMQKFLKEITLLGPPFVKDDKTTVENLLKSKSASVEQFVLFVVGEGIEKKTTDFAAEVKAQAGAATRV